VTQRSVVLFEDLENPRWDTIERTRQILVAKFGSQADNEQDVVEVLQQLASHLRAPEPPKP
jgi:hypothetical protein